MPMQPFRTRPCPSVLLDLLAMLVVIVVGGFRPQDAHPQVVLAQRGHPPEPNAFRSRPHTVSPSSGAAGTEVTISMSQLPATTPLWLGIGGMGSGFEALSMVFTNAKGEFTQTVTVPTWAGRDRPHAFIVFDAYFNRLALTGPFDVTGLDGTLLRRGEIGGIQSTCQTLVDEDGATYTLAGGLPALTRGELVIVEGLMVEKSPDCNDTRALLVTRVFSERRR